MELRCIICGLRYVSKKLLILAITISIFTFLAIIFRDGLIVGESAIESLPEDFFRF